MRIFIYTEKCEKAGKKFVFVTMVSLSVVLNPSKCSILNLFVKLGTGYRPSRQNTNIKGQIAI